MTWEDILKKDSGWTPENLGEKLRELLVQAGVSEEELPPMPKLERISTEIRMPDKLPSFKDIDTSPRLGEELNRRRKLQQGDEEE